MSVGLGDRGQTGARALNMALVYSCWLIVGRGEKNSNVNTVVFMRVNYF